MRYWMLISCMQGKIAPYIHRINTLWRTTKMGGQWLLAISCPLRVDRGRKKNITNYFKDYKYFLHRKYLNDNSYRLRPLEHVHCTVQYVDILRRQNVFNPVLLTLWHMEHSQCLTLELQPRLIDIAHFLRRNLERLQTLTEREWLTRTNRGINWFSLKDVWAG